jgi:hypothetical protein
MRKNKRQLPIESKARGATRERARTSRPKKTFGPYDKLTIRRLKEEPSTLRLDDINGNAEIYFPTSSKPALVFSMRPTSVRTFVEYFWEKRQQHSRNLFTIRDLVNVYCLHRGFIPSTKRWAGRIGKELKNRTGAYQVPKPKERKTYLVLGRRAKKKRVTESGLWYFPRRGWTAGA